MFDYRRGRSIALCFLLAGLGAPLATAQDPAPDEGGEDPPPAVATTEELQELQRRLAVLELEQKISDAKKAIRDNETPATSVEPLAGEAKLEGEGSHHAEMLAFTSLAAAAQAVAKEVAPVLAEQVEEEAAREAAKEEAGEGEEVDKDRSGKPLFISEVPSIEKVQLYALISDRLEVMAERIDRLKDKADSVAPHSPALALASATTLVSAVADLVALFQSDTTIKTHVVTKSPTAFKAELFAALKDLNIKATIPGFSREKIGRLRQRMADIADLAQRKREQQKVSVKPGLLAATNAREEADAALAKAKKGKDQAAITKAQQAQRAAAFAEEQWKKLDTEHSSVLAAWDSYVDALTVGNDERQPLLQGLTTVDLVWADAGATALFFEISSAGAETRVTNSIWHSGRIGYMGGVVITWFLVDSSGTTLSAGVAQNITGKTYKPREIGSVALPKAKTEPE